jgi:hypothetical protein
MKKWIRIVQIIALTLLFTLVGVYLLMQDKAADIPYMYLDF